MDTKKLRQKILDLAIRGKLVPQDPNDEPASVLLERIRAEKERLIKEGKIKKSKASKTADKPHYENVPFEVPSSWEWCNITEVTSKITDGTHNSPVNSPQGDYKYVTAKNIKSSGIILDNITYVSKEVHNEIYTRCNPENGDLLYIKDGATTGVVTINTLNEPFSLLSSVALIKPLKNISNYFLLFYLQSSLCYNSVRESMKGVGITRITLKQIEKWNLPLPPFSEQQRIIKELQRWFSLLDQIEQRKAELQTSIKHAKSKILDFAIHGKLVPQDPSDEPASELLKRINPKAEITCDNGQYGKLPKGWCLATGASLFKQMKSTKPYGEVFKYIDIDSIDNKSNIIASIKRIPTIEAPSRASRYTEKGDVVFSMVRPYLKNIAQITEDNCIASTGFYICSPHNCMLPQFCYYMMLSNYVVDGLNGFMKGDNSPSITKGNIDNWLFPIPPLAEQKRIVNAIEKAFAKLDTIMESL